MGYDSLIHSWKKRSTGKAKLTMDSLFNVGQPSIKLLLTTVVFTHRKHLSGHVPRGALLITSDVVYKQRKCLKTPCIFVKWSSFTLRCSIPLRQVSPSQSNKLQMFIIQLHFGIDCLSAHMYFDYVQNFI